MRVCRVRTRTAVLLAIVAAPEAVIAIFGPTGVGKTGIAIELAERLQAEGEDPVAISADALQVYRGLEVLTGAATPEEQERLEHRLISFLPVTETFSAGQFAALAHEEIDAALAAGRRPIVVGGTGLYLQAALTDLELRPPPPPGVRERILAEAAERGVEALHAELAERAPEAAAAIDAGRPHARGARARAARDGGGAGARRRGVAAVDGGAPAPDRAGRPDDGARAPLRADRRARGRDGRRRRGGRGPARRRRRRVGHRAQGARVRRAVARRRGCHEAAHAQLREAAAHLDAAARARQSP